MSLSPAIHNTKIWIKEAVWSGIGFWIKKKKKRSYCWAGCGFISKPCRDLCVCVKGRGRRWGGGGGLLEQLVSGVKVPGGWWERKVKEWKTEMRRHQRTRHGYHHGYRQLRLQKQRLCHVVGMCMWESKGDITSWGKKGRSCSAVAVGLVLKYCPVDAREKIPQLTPLCPTITTTTPVSRGPGFC